MSTDLNVKEPGCAEVPEFERLSFFMGQHLSAQDFRTEQAYFREKLRLHNRCLHGWGIVCGLGVEPLPLKDCCEPKSYREKRKVREELGAIDQQIQQAVQQVNTDDKRGDDLEQRLHDLRSKQEALRRRDEEICVDDEKLQRNDARCEPQIVLHCGVALDCCGNEIIVRDSVPVNLWSLLSGIDRHRLLEHCGEEIYLRICYCEEPTHKSRPVIPDSCGALSDCNYGRYRDSFRLTASLEPPAADERCEPCCDACVEHCVVLAKIHWNGATEIQPEDIDLSVRRPLTLYNPATIEGISWQHGATYPADQARDVLGTASKGVQTDGLEVRFSRPVFAETITDGVIDLWRIQGGSGPSGMFSHINGKFVDKPDSGLITSFKYRDETGETLYNGDRVLIILRTDFILDECCRAVDGNHIGGRVPQLEGYNPPQAINTQHDEKDDCDDDDRRPPASKQPMPCLTPPGAGGVWRSGNGVPGGTFESWIFID